MLTIVTRAQWHAKPPKKQWTPWPVGQPTGWTIHWEGAGGHPNHADCAGEVASIQDFHMSKDDYIDIAYNWLVCNHGTTFQGRPISFQSAAQNKGNPLRISVCYIGGPRMPFTAAGIQTINELITLGPASAKGYVIDHHDEPSCSTSCAGQTINSWVHAGRPGQHLQATIPAPSPPPPPLPASGVSHPVLRVGNVGGAVQELQRKLNGIAHAGLRVDGKFGPATLTAVKAFQHFTGLTQDGVAGPKTWLMLDYFAALNHIH